MNFECEFCNKTFNLKGNMIKHQKTAKYCINIQKSSTNDSKVEHISYVCKFCNKNFTQANHLSRHIPNCIEKYKDEIKELNSILEEKENKIKELDEKLVEAEQKIKTVRLEVENEFYKSQSKENQSTINEIAKQPRVQTNTNNNQKILITTPIDMSKPIVQQAIQNNFSDEYLIQGQKGVARFAVDNILKDEQGRLTYICTDPSRQVFQFKDEDGMVQKDIRATKLTKALLDAEIKASSHRIAWDKMKDGDDVEFQTYTDHYYEIKDLETDNTTFSKELATLTV